MRKEIVCQLDVMIIHIVRKHYLSMRMKLIGKVNVLYIQQKWETNFLVKYTKYDMKNW